uniref:Uncharacterized protein n=1 Tax=Anguilla anguilla TaxID=7936 RepID=A0A0E9SF83_ANGAN
MQRSCRSPTEKFSPFLDYLGVQLFSQVGYCFFHVRLLQRLPDLFLTAVVERIQIVSY